MTDMIARALASKALSQSGSTQYKNKSEFPSVGEEGQLYIDLDTNMIYYWDMKNLSYKSLNISGEAGEVTKEVVKEVIQESVLDGGTASTNII